MADWLTTGQPNFKFAMNDEELISAFSGSALGFSFCRLSEDGKTPEQVAELYKAYLEAESLIDDIDAINSHGYWELLRKNKERFTQIMQNPRVPQRFKIPPRDLPPAKKSQETYVYLMKCQRTGRVKIGKSNNPSVRERTLQSEAPDVVLTHKWKTDPQKEAYLHAAFHNKRYRGEWFDLNSDDIDTIEVLMGDAQ